MNENYLNMCISEDLKYELIRKLKPYNAIDVIREIEKIPTCSTETKRKKGDGRGRSEYQEFISMGLTGLIKFNETKNLQFFGYWGNHYLITLEKDYNYDLVYHENKEEKKYNTALGVGFATKSPVSINLMIGYGAYDILGDFNLLPTAEFGIYYCFPNH